MLLWFVFAVMTALATIAVLWPLGRRREATAADGNDVAVYRDQLQELERDRDRGLIAPAEADAARAEIARRVLRAAEAAGAAAEGRRSLARPVAAAVAVGIPAVVLSLYLAYGSPDLPGQPLEARLAASGEADVAAMVARVERHLAANPDDVEGWRVLAPVYVRAGRYGDAANAIRNVIRVEGPTPALQEDLGEMIVAAADGLVTPEAEEVFAAALAADPTRVKARYYTALALVQAGNPDAAIAEYDAIIRSSPADAPWLDAVRRDRDAALMAAGRPVGSAPAAAAAPGPDAEDVAAAAGMSQEDRDRMIAGMVDGLAARLREDPDDAEGWQRLIRAYGVLGRPDDARAAWESARAAFADAPETLAAIRQVASDAGVVVE